MVDVGDYNGLGQHDGQIRHRVNSQRRYSPASWNRSILNGSPSVATLYDTQIPLAQNAGIAGVSTVLEPAAMGVGGLVMLSLSWALRLAANGRRNS
jgi:hypothetical protein